MLAVIAASVMYLQAAAAALAALPEKGSGRHREYVRALRHGDAGYRTVLHVSSRRHLTGQVAGGLDVLRTLRTVLRRVCLLHAGHGLLSNDRSLLKKCRRMN